MISGVIADLHEQPIIQIPFLAFVPDEQIAEVTVQARTEWKKQNKTKQKQNKTKQNKTKQNKNKTRQKKNYTNQNGKKERERWPILGMPPLSFNYILKQLRHGVG